MYFVVKGPGFYVKLPGEVDLDPATGQLKATFDNTPQLPFSRMRVDFQGGSQAPLATPAACGTYSTPRRDHLMGLRVHRWRWTAPTRIDQNCDRKAFTPSFTAGTTNGGRRAVLALHVLADPPGCGWATSRAVEMGLPKGMLADIGSVAQ